MSDTTNESIWRFDESGGALALREGDPAPDVPGLSLSHFDFFTSGSRILANKSNRLLIPVQLAGEPTTTTALYASDPLGNLRLGLRTNTNAPTQNGPPRTVLSLVAGGIGDGNVCTAAVSLQPGAGLYQIEAGCPRSGCDRADVAGDDCVVDLTDLATVLSQFGTVGGALAADTDRDGDVDLTDLAFVLAAFGADCR